MTTQAEVRGGARDSLLDLLRSAALFRVVLWHAFAATWLTYLAAMPVMFFVAGALLGSGGTGRPGAYRAFLTRRGRRLLLPFWAYGLAIGATMLYVPLHDERWATLPGILLRAASWVLPLVDPVDSTWHGGWLSNHLWYLRAYLWILLLAPVVVAFARRVWIAAPLLVLGLVQLEVVGRMDVVLPGDSATRVVVGDVLAYGLFAVLGAAFAQRRVPVRRDLAVGAALASAAAAFGFLRVLGVPGGGVNASYPLIVSTGLAWLFAIASFEPALRRLAERPAVQRATAAVCGRAVTIYLWHPAAIVVSQALVPDGTPAVARGALVLASTGALVVASVFCVGWVEDVAAGRVRLHLPAVSLARLGAIVPATVGVLAFTVPVIVSPAAAGARAGVVAPPSYREALASSAFARRAVPPDAPIRLRDGALPKGDLLDALDEWVADNPAVAKANVGLIVQGQVWFASSNGRGKPSGIRTTQRFRVHSLTKTFTLALVLREVDAGRIALDQPIPVIRGIRRPPGALAITPRHLLTHSSGLADYTASPSYRDTRTYTPQQAVNLSLAQPLEHPIGDKVHYANSNFFYLGLLLEQVTGRPYAELLASLAADAGLKDTALGPDQPGWVGFSAGGVESTIADLTRWGAAFFTPDRVVPAARLHEATALGPHNLGLGLWPLCPCWTDAAGRRHATAIGHEVGYGGLMQYPQQMTLMVLLDPPGPLLTPHVESLGEALRDVLRR